LILQSVQITTRFEAIGLRWAVDKELSIRAIELSIAMNNASLSRRVGKRAERSQTLSQILTPACPPKKNNKLTIGFDLTIHSSQFTIHNSRLKFWRAKTLGANTIFITPPITHYLLPFIPYF